MSGVAQSCSCLCHTVPGSVKHSVPCCQEPPVTADRCICDGAAYHNAEENRARHPFIVNPGCPVHAPVTADHTPERRRHSPNPRQPDRCASMDPWDSGLQCTRLIHEDDRHHCGQIAWQSSASALSPRCGRAAALVAEWREWCSSRCQACYDEEFGKVHSHDCGITRAEVVARLDAALRADRDALAAHLADVEARLANAWGEGWQQGMTDQWASTGDELVSTANPYRAALHSDPTKPAGAKP